VSEERAQPTGPDELMQVVYEELRALASAYVRQERPDHTLQTTALVHEAWLRLHGRGAVAYDGRAHFFRAAALAMRRILLNHAEKRRALKRGGGRREASLTELIDLRSPGSDVDMLALSDALDRLSQLDEQKARVVELRYFGGCTIDQTAEALGISTATVEREWRFARAWLRAEVDELCDDGGHTGPTVTPVA
jgi:RNA polymerase sigma factor (TIGR02999 family)